MPGTPPRPGGRGRARLHSKTPGEPAPTLRGTVPTTAVSTFTDEEVRSFGGLLCPGTPREEVPALASSGEPPTRPLQAGLVPQPEEAVTQAEVTLALMVAAAAEAEAEAAAMKAVIKEAVQAMAARVVVVGAASAVAEAEASAVAEAEAAAVAAKAAAAVEAEAAAAAEAAAGTAAAEAKVVTASELPAGLTPRAVLLRARGYVRNEA